MRLEENIGLIRQSNDIISIDVKTFLRYLFRSHATFFTILINFSTFFFIVSPSIKKIPRWIYIAPQAAYAASAVLCVTDSWRSV